ncbi:hypothetical protein Egran_03838 [Elaphomyces granulatus]|uniref:AN1-type domain-containing protein n=1 Tax=Elaphomyces granulatus TaxID=519963 RepID=A0A232LW66_9EURO|nr:hypothetical protein Egran_03838 [Elaphomyces granulatus]
MSSSPSARDRSGGSNLSQDSESFTQMADQDLDSIGRNCQYEFCRQLDFLPFRCESCKGTFCLDHRTETAHHCTRAGDWAARRRNDNLAGDSVGDWNSVNGRSLQKPTIYNSDQCSHPTCKTLINTVRDPAVHCQNCNREYCLKHRLQEEHDCAKLIPLGARAGQRGRRDGPSPNETLRSMFSRVRTWGKEKTNAATSNLTRPKPTSAVAQLNELKRAAMGDPGIPNDKRLFLNVFGTSEAQKAEPPSGKYYFDSRWKVGRVLDDAARKLKVENVNNRGGGEEARLRIFHVESGQFLEFSDAIGAGNVKQGHTIVLMRGAGSILNSF